MRIFLILYLVYLANGIFGFVNWSIDKDRKKWNENALNKIKETLSKKINNNVAKNIILFLGDGMGPSTVTAGRIRKGQLNGKNGEDEITNMEKLPHVGLSKTYNIDAQTGDSAGTATAYLTGVKTRIGVIGLDGNGIDCATSKTSKLESILKWANRAGKSTGILTTQRVTDATPAACYANAPSRSWETFDGVGFNHSLSDQGCKDIADQLISENSFLNLVIGGGRTYFLPENQAGKRIDNRNLIQEWKDKMKIGKSKAKYVTDLIDFRALKPNEYEHLLVLLADNDMDWESDRNPNEQPSIVEMTEKAINLLSSNSNGFFLIVESGRIDIAHHFNNARRALDDFVVFDEAIGKTIENTNESETLIVVTADHSHVFTLGGYPRRGNSVFGININQKDKPVLDENLNLSYTALAYANGPGAVKEIRLKNLTNEQTEDVNYKQESIVFLRYETHGGEDVAVYSSGPMSFLFDATFEQNYIAHVMAYSACIGPYNTTNGDECHKNRGVLVPSNNGLSRYDVKLFNIVKSILILNKIFNL